MPERVPFPVLAGVVGGRMLLAANDGRSGRELWAIPKTDIFLEP